MPALRGKRILPPLRVYICGRLAIEQGPACLRESDFPARQGRRLWAFLVVHRARPVGRGALAAAIWGDEMPDTWDGALSTLVSRLRTSLRRLGSAIEILHDVGRYELVLPEGCFIDLERARAAIHDAETFLRRRDYDLALAEARVAMEIAGRSFLPGEDSVWIEAQRQALAGTVLRALECTVEGELGRGQPQRAETEARYLIGVDPLRESAYRLLMRALAAGGNAGQARQILAECRRVLKENGAMAPSAETENLFNSLTRR